MSSPDFLPPLLRRRRSRRALFAAFLAGLILAWCAAPIAVGAQPPAVSVSLVPSEARAVEETPDAPADRGERSLRSPMLTVDWFTPRRRTNATHRQVQPASLLPPVTSSR